MRVLHITRDFPPRHCGGISTAVGGLARAQARGGLGVAVLSFDAWRPCAGRSASTPPAVETDTDMTILRVESPAQLAAARAFARAQAPSLLHVHHGMLWEVAAELRAALGVPAVKSVHVVHHRINELRGTRERTRSLVGQERAVAAADRVIVPSRAAAAALLAAYPDLAPRLRIAGHGIDDTAAARAAAARHATTPARGPLLAAGRFDELKGTPELFDALRAVLAVDPAATCVVSGGVPANRRAERRWVRRWHAAAPAALAARVRFTGWLQPAELVAHYRDAAALIAPSRFETFGLVVLEAMLHGLPVAASAAGGIAELIEHGVSGLLSAPGDTAELAAQALALATDPELAARLSRTAAATVRAAHLWEHVLPRQLAVYGELC